MADNSAAAKTRVEVAGSAPKARSDRKRPYERGAAARLLASVTLPPGTDELVTVLQAQRALGLLARSSIYKLVKKGLLRPVYLLGSTKFRLSDVRALQESGF